jgi:hypothetical protein
LGTDPKKGIFFSEWGKFKLGLPYDCGAKKRALGQMVGNSGYDTILTTIWVQQLGVVLRVTVYNIAHYSLLAIKLAN